MSLRLDHMNEYKVWKNMRARCSSKCNKDSVYQLHNIKVCDRWNVFDNFFKDMGVKPDGYTIDRIDTLGDYCPENCRWASWSTQSKNRGSFNTVVNYNGREMCLKDLSKIVNIDYTTLIYRFKKFKNLSIEEIINYKDPRTKIICVEGVNYTTDEFCNKFSIPKKNLYDRLHKGWSISKIIHTEVKRKI